jgi:hypothetical protein
VTDHHFLFALKLSDQDRFDAMLGDLAARVLGHVGFAGDAIDDVLGGLREALARGFADGLQHCDVQFRAEAAELIIVVSYGGGREWRETRRLP